MKSVSIASGSKGNCTLIVSDPVKILIDAGLTLKELEKKLAEIEISPKDIDAILVTHEHTDHCKGVGTFARKYKTKVYVPAAGYDVLSAKIGYIPKSQLIAFASNTFFIKDTEINVFDLPHDSKFCCGYSVTKNNKKISIATDLGHTTLRILQSLQNSDIVYLEANHDIETLLKNPKYSASLKNRILSPKGHLSNVASAEAIIKLVQMGVKQIVLSHLSEENNSPALAYNTIKEYLKNQGIIEGRNVFIDVSTQSNIGTVFEVK